MSKDMPLSIVYIIFDSFKNMKIVRYLMNRIKDREFIKRQINLNRLSYLKPGKYKIINIDKTIVYKDKEANRFLCNMALDWTSSLPIVRLKFKKFLAQFLKVEIKDNGIVECKGDFALFTQNGDIKIFITSEKFVLNNIYNRNDYHKLKLTHIRFAHFFNTPVVDFNDDENLIKELLIDAKHIMSLSVNEKQGILTSYLNNFKNYLYDCKKKGDLIHLSYCERWPSVDTKNSIIKDLNLQYQIEFEKIKWPYVLCHGDFYIKNILINERNFFLIDWEHSDKHIFFYDALHFMVLQAMKYSDFSLLDLYFNGYYDGCLTNIFEILDIKYTPKKRIVYLAYCVAERLAKFDTFKEITEYERYIKVLKEIEHQYETKE